MIQFYILGSGHKVLFRGGGGGGGRIRGVMIFFEVILWGHENFKSNFMGS